MTEGWEGEEGVDDRTHLRIGSLTQTKLLETTDEKMPSIPLKDSFCMFHHRNSRTTMSKIHRYTDQQPRGLSWEECL